MEMINCTEYTESPEIEKLAEALCKAQMVMDNAEKSAHNPHFNRAYSDLASVWNTCRAPLTANGIAVIQTPIKRLSEYVMRTKLVHTSGQWIACEIGMILVRQDMQALGSAMTYARRYGLMSLAGIAPADDDGNAAVDKGNEAKKSGGNNKKPENQSDKKPEIDKHTKVIKDFLGHILGDRQGDERKTKMAEISKILGVEDMRDIPAAPEIRKKDWISQLTAMWNKEQDEQREREQEKLIAEEQARLDESALDEYNREQAELMK